MRAEERRLIHRVFEFSDTLVREAMVPRPEIAAISADCSLEDIKRAFEQHRYSRLPVYRESLDDVIGVIHSKDLMPFLLRPEEFHLENVLHPPIYVVDTARLEDVLRQMQKAKAHFGFVVDEHGGVEGIITLEDLLEEIVGEISDEHDVEVNEQINQVDSRTYLLDGALAVRDLNRRLKHDDNMKPFVRDGSWSRAASGRNNRTRQPAVSCGESRAPARLERAA